ncbi:MAG: hypothetical protein HQK53_15810, partial [Oligoflexia bacterium]|nr:hypothetical protein [Oligoflexia bacterium]
MSFLIKFMFMVMGTLAAFSVLSDEGIFTEIEFPALVKEYSGKILYRKEDGRYYYQPSSSLGPRIVIGEMVDNKSVICAGKYHSVCDLVIGKKRERVDGALEGVNTVLLTLHESSTISNGSKNLFSAYNSLDEYVFASPNQEDAGSCLYMALTGAMEVLLNQKAPIAERVYEGNTDLSERFLMNISTPSGYIQDWRTDTVYAYNYKEGALLNRTYRYTKGWFTEAMNGTLSPQKDGVSVEKSQYGTRYNWIDEYGSALRKNLIEVPKVERTLIFRDPAHDEWNAGIMDSGVVDRIKQELRSKNAPVVIIYNHYAYWHTV